MVFLLEFTVFSIFCGFILVLVKVCNRSKAAKKLPPSPWKLPFIGNMHHLIGSAPHHALRKLAQKHGPLLHLQLGEISTIIISSPKLAKEIMKTHDLAFANRAEFLLTNIILYNRTDIAAARYGGYWRQMRKICTLELLSAKRVRSFSTIRQDEASRLIASIKALANAGGPFNLTEKISDYTSSMVIRAAFGNLGKECQNAFLLLLKELLPFASTWEIADLFPSYKFLHHFSCMKSLMKVHHKMDKLLDNIIDSHIVRQSRMKKSTGEHGHEDLIDVLLRVKESGDLQFPVTKNNIKAVMLDMFIGGTDTSTTVVEWAMSEMIRNPKVMAKAQTEIRTAFKGKKFIEEKDIQEMKYLKLVIKETLRLHPPFPLLVPRECREECEIDGYIIPVKTKLMINVSAIGRDPSYWEDPECFKPERFENNSLDFTGTHFEYLPFGAGRRVCPGISFGLANVELPLAVLLYHFDWNLPNGLKSNDLDMTEFFGVTASRKTKLRLLANLYDPSLLRP